MLRSATILEHKQTDGPDVVRRAGPRCREVDGGYEERRINGYDVEYRYRGETYMSRLNYDPGERIRVRVSVTPAD